MLRFSALQVCALSAAFGGSAEPAHADAVWNADSGRSGITLRVSRLLGAKITGTLPFTSATIVTAEGELVPLMVDAMLSASAISTGDPQRDAQLRSDRFFDVARFPAITFASERVEATGPERFNLDGELTMHGITRPITFDMRVASMRRDPDGRRHVRYEGTARFQRYEYGMTYARGIVGNDVLLDVAIEAVN